ncbi:hypothetical protein RhiJN_16429 [Ceratobasidium sp. AG-Ba]|nr:hypothetical protein RhiJN_16429 [Ceratobasidium sp. AG-Ba]
MPGWTSISALVSNATSLSYRFTPPKSIGEKDASVLLDEINRILVDTTATLNLYKNVLSQADYESFKAQHRVLHVKLQKELIYQRNFNEPLAEQGRIPSQTGETRASVQVRAVRLLADAEDYQNKVVDASSRANSAAPFPDEEPLQKVFEPQIETEHTLAHALTTPPTIPDDPSPTGLLLRPFLRPRTPVMKSNKPSLAHANLGLMKRIDMPSLIGCLLTAENVDSTTFEHKEVRFAVTHTPLADEEVASFPCAPGKKLYRRTVIISYGQDVLEIPDPQPRELNDNEINLDADALFALQEVTQKWVGEILSRDID